MIIVSVVITSLIMVNKYSSGTIGYELWLLLFVMVGYGLLGFLDDFIKVAMKRNLGLTSGQNAWAASHCTYFLFHSAIQ